MFNLKIDQSFFGEAFLLNLILKLHYSTWNWNFWRTCSFCVSFVGGHVLPDFFAELLGEKLLLNPVGPNLEVSITPNCGSGPLYPMDGMFFIQHSFLEMIVKPLET